MALSFSCLIVPFFIFFVNFPNLYSWACPPPGNLLCGSACIPIRPPFCTNITPGCGGSDHMISCNDHSTPIVQFYGKGRSYIVENIDYDRSTITIQDQEFSKYVHVPDNCTFLYKFDPHIPLLEPSFLPQSVGPGQSLFNCSPNSGYDFCTDIFHELYGCNICRGYDLYFSSKSEDETSDFAGYCRASPSPSFGWTLSFTGDGDLSLQFAAYYSYPSQIDSDYWHLDWGCFKHNTTGDSKYLCNNRCQDSAGKSNASWKIAIGAGVGAGVFIAGGLLCLLWYKSRERRQRSTSSILLGSTGSSDPSSNRDPESGSSQYQTTLFAYEELEEATNGFSASRELGGGGFGIVYRGKLRDGRVVAVKRLYKNNWKRVEQFMNEVEILSRLRHQNLVSLYGCTSRRSRELLLVYEYLPNGTVADHLHGPHAHDRALTWPIRMRIAVETADALAYLHAVEPQIIHRDVKTSNILLDRSFHVKVADFGLSRLFPLDATHVSTAPQGTPGYVDPFYHECFQLTDKSDVYSFGVVLAELISSKPAVDTNRTYHEINLSNMAVSRIQNCQLEQLVDPSLGYQSDWEMRTMITLVAELALSCLQLEREMRPSIKEVLKVLRGIESGEYKEVAEADVPVTEDDSLLKNILSNSPDCIAGRWESRPTTPNTSE